MASSNDPASRDLLLMWISAYFDGELTADEEEQLFAAMDGDPALEAEFLQMEKLLGGSHALPGLTDAIMSAVAPEAVSATADGAALLASAQADAELDEAGAARLHDVTRSNPATAREVAAFTAAAEGISVALSGLPETPSVRAASAEAAGAAHRIIAADERAGLLFSAALDGELDTTEASELHELVAAGRVPDLATAALQEAVVVALRAPIEADAAAKAGAAALHVIEASVVREAEERAKPAQAARPALGDRVRALFGRFAPPLTLATAAVVMFVVIQQPPGQDLASDAPPEDWFAAFPDMKTTVDQQMLAAATPGNLEVLGDNAADVQAIDSGSQMAAVFSTEATSITVIWVPEPDTDGSEETGT